MKTVQEELKQALINASHRADKTENYIVVVPEQVIEEFNKIADSLSAFKIDQRDRRILDAMLSNLTSFLQDAHLKSARSAAIGVKPIVFNVSLDEYGGKLQ